LRFLFLEPFFGGSHRDFAEGLAAHSRHRIDILPLPARFWKWRMRGASLWFIREAGSLSAYDGLIASGLMSLSDFKTLAGGLCPPALLYLHETQLEYPVAPGERRDVHFGFTDITSALAARRAVFNSARHRDAFFAALPRFLRKMPEYHPMWVVEAIRDRSDVCHPGCWFSTDDPPLRPAGDGPPVIVWNQRWEFDKGPAVFFEALFRLKDQGIPFRLMVMGERYRDVPPIFPEARSRLADRILHWGYVPRKSDYQALLARGDIVVSTALQENFGIAMVEAMRLGCLPLLPNRLSYPEILPAEFHDALLYTDDSDLPDRLAGVLKGFDQFQEIRSRVSRAMGRYAWSRRIIDFDDRLAELAAGAQIDISVRGARLS